MAESRSMSEQQGNVAISLLLALVFLEAVPPENERGLGLLAGLCLGAYLVVLFVTETIKALRRGGKGG